MPNLFQKAQNLTRSVEQPRGTLAPIPLQNQYSSTPYSIVGQMNKINKLAGNASHVQGNEPKGKGGLKQTTK